MLLFFRGSAFMKQLVLMLVVFGLFAPSLCASDKINFVLIVTDDHGADAACYGARGIKTPNMDKLAQQGVLFREAFSTCASCSPARSALLTGMWPHSNGHWRNTLSPRASYPDSEFTPASSYRNKEKVGVHEDIPTLVEILNQNGYETGISGKFHLSPPWKYAFKHREEGSTGVTVPSILKRCGDKPFFIQVNIGDTHRPWDMKQTQKMNLPAIAPDAIDIPGDLPDTSRMRQEYCSYLYSVQAADAVVGQVLDALRKFGKENNTIVFLTGDQGPSFQRGKATAYDRGVRTVFLASGPGIQKGVDTRALVSHVDIMPTILDYAGMDIPKTVQGRSLAALLKGDKLTSWRSCVFSEHNSHGPNLENEYYPTRGAYDGRLHYLRNLTPERRADKPIEYYASSEFQGKGLPWIVPDCIPYGVYRGRTDCVQAAIAAKEEFPIPYAALQQSFNRPAEELYDLHSDPYELHNLVNDSRYETMLNELRRALDDWMKDTNDPGAKLKDVPRRTGME